MDYEKLMEALLVVLIGITLIVAGVFTAISIIAVTIIYPIMILLWALIAVATYVVYNCMM